MPVPIAQSNPLSDQLDAQSLTPESSTPVSYLLRPALTVEQGGSGSLYRDLVGPALQRDGSEMLSKDEAKNQFGTEFDGPVSRDYASFKSQQDGIQKALEDSLARGGSNSANKTWLGFGLTQAAGLLDVPGDAAAVLSDGITKFAPVGRVISAARDVSPIVGRVTQGVAKASAFSAINEPLQYALSDDKQNMSLDQAAQSLGAGALFLGITEGLFGHTPLRFYSEEENIPSSGQQKTMDLLEDHLAPETKATMGQTAVARSMQGASFDPINDLIGLDPRILKHEALIGKTLSFEERANLLQSMDDGTYTLPKQELAVLDNDGKIIEPNEQDALQKELAAEAKTKEVPKSGVPDITDNKATLPPGNSNKLGFFNIEPLANALATSRVNTLRSTLLLSATERPPAIESTPTLTDPLKNVTTLLQPYEQPKESIQAGSSGGTVGGARGVSTKSEAKPTPNKWGGLSSIRTGGASFLARGGRVRFRNTETYEHGAITFVRDANNKFVASRAPKGTFTPTATKSFDSFNEAHNWLKTQGFDEARQVEAIKDDKQPLAEKPSKATLAKTSMQNKEKGFEVQEHEAPKLTTEQLRNAEDVMISRTKAQQGLRKYGLALWSKDGGWYPNGVMVEKTGETFEYGTPKFDKIFGHARELVENFIHKMQKFHDEVMLSDLVQNDKTAVSYMPHQLPKPLDKTEGYRLFTLHNRNEGSEPTSSWSRDTSIEAHAHLSVLRDKEGKPYLAVHEAQGGYSNNLKPQESMKMLADRLREYAQEQGMPLVIPNSKTAATIYGRDSVNATFSRSYSKGGYVRKGFSQAMDSERNLPVTLEKLWNPMGEGSPNFEGLVIPDETKFVQSVKEINAEQDAKEAGYNQAVNCVTGR